MSRESKKKTKEWLGKSPSIVLGHDVVSTISPAVSGVVTHTLLGNDGIHNAVSAGRVDGFIVDVYPAITSGVVNVAMSVAGEVKASGSLGLATNSRSLNWFWRANSDDQVVLASGDAIEMQYSISPALNEDGVTAYYINGRTLVTYTE